MDNLLFYPDVGSFLEGQIRPDQLTRLSFGAIINPYNRILFHPLRISFRQTPPTCLRLTNKLKKQSIFTLFFNRFLMNSFKIEGDLGRHHLSISAAYTECGISTSTINRSEGKTFPPKVQLSEGRVGFRVYQIEEWLNGKRGGWN